MYNNDYKFTCEVINLKKIVAFFVLFALVLLPATSALAEPQHMKRIKEATRLINKMAIEEDAENLADVVKSGKAVAIFPNVKKAGFIVGGQYGDGVVFVKDGKGGWLGPAFMTIVGGSIGYQIGLESVGLVLVVTNQKGVVAFTGGKSFKLGADIDVAAGPVGRRASASTDTRFTAAIYSYSMAQGLFAGVGVDGSVINQNREASKNYWGKALEAKQALSRPAKDKRVTDLVKALNNLQKKAK